MQPLTNQINAAHAPLADAMKRPILLIDDDKAMAEMLAQYLGIQGYSVHSAYTGRDGLEHLQAGTFILVILDIMLPDLNGFSVLREIREKSRIPVVMLTTRTAVVDKVNGLEGGADDYVPKPFTPIELLARIRTVLRRGQPTRFGSPFLAIDDLVLDAGARTVSCRGRQIECTAAEYDLLHALASNAGEVVARERLSRLALGRSPYAGDRGLDNLISILRRKLGPDSNGRDRFHAVRNIGYLFLLSNSADSQKQKP